MRLNTGIPLPGSTRVARPHVGIKRSQNYSKISPKEAASVFLSEVMFFKISQIIIKYILATFVRQFDTKYLEMLPKCRTRVV